MIHEFDWRLGPLFRVLATIEDTLVSVHDPDFDAGDWFLENAEPLIGLGFVAAQTCALGTRTDINRVRANRGKPSLTKVDYYKCDPIVLLGSTRIEVINATANCFKHREEWLQWPTNETTQVLSRVGITQETEFPCAVAMQLLGGAPYRLTDLHSILADWRAHVTDQLS